jgi:hypothetical protein
MQEYRTVLLGGGMAASYAAKEFVEASGNAGKLGMLAAPATQPSAPPQATIRAAK